MCKLLTFDSKAAVRKDLNKLLLGFCSYKYVQDSFSLITSRVKVYLVNYSSAKNVLNKTCTHPETVVECNVCTNLI
jgi:hypothetical protein